MLYSTERTYIASWTLQTNYKLWVALFQAPWILRWLKVLRELTFHLLTQRKETLHWGGRLAARFQHPCRPHSFKRGVPFQPSTIPHATKGGLESRKSQLSLHVDHFVGVTSIGAQDLDSLLDPKFFVIIPKNFPCPFPNHFPEKVTSTSTSSVDPMTLWRW